MLGPEQRKAIHTLQQIIEQEEQIKLKMNWGMLAQKDRSEAVTEDYFHYNEKGDLLGYLAIYQFGKKIESICLVEPENRRRGIAKRLLDQAYSDWHQQAAPFLINCPDQSTSGKGFCQAIGATHQFTEHQMVCREIPMPYTKEGVRIRPAVSKDLETIFCLDKEGFGLTLTAEDLSATAEVENGTYMIEVNGQSVGKLRLEQRKQESWIYGFVLQKEERGKGFGRAVLTDVVHREVSNGKIVWLDVVTENEQALSLYKKCGFTVEGAQAYYKYEA